jgi:Ferroportin1 (FPN1)
MDALNPSSSPKDELSLEHGSSSMNRNEDGELEPLLEDGRAPTEELARVASGTSSSSDSAVLTGVGMRLYISHFLSTWNSRVFEFGAVLFIAEIFPGTLLAVSIYAVVRSASAIVLAPQVGRYIDANDRLKVVRSSIGLSCQPAASPPCAMRLIELGAGSWPAACCGIVLCRLMDVVGVRQHTIAA